MDKAWVHLSRLFFLFLEELDLINLVTKLKHLNLLMNIKFACRFSEEYRDGARNFVNLAHENLNSEMIGCPCVKCRNLKHHHFDTVYEHLVIKGMDPTYTTWVLHGEQPSKPNMEDVEMPDSFRMFKDFYMQHDEVIENPQDGREEEIENLVSDAETPLYPGCRAYTKMSASIALFKHKATHGLSDNGFDELINLVRDMLPENNTLPNSFYSIKKLLKTFNLGYKKIHACLNDCCLYRNELEHAELCPKCGCSRWKVDQRSRKIHKGIPAKVLRYFPIIPRFKRMFGITEMSELLRWHSTHKSQDGKMRHPVDSLGWETINKRWPHFALDPRNIRLGLATDGFNPFKDLSSRYSCWPVILTIYNLPPSLCMLKESLMLSLLISGPKQPGNDIDVYLAPLVDDLKLLWSDGVEVYDAVTKSTFNLKAILMWTINDFPAYGNVSG